MGLGSTQPWTEMSTRSISWGKGGRCIRLTTLPPSCAIVMKSGNLNFLEPSGSLQAWSRTDLPFTKARRLRTFFLSTFFHPHLMFSIASHPMWRWRWQLWPLAMWSKLSPLGYKYRALICFTLGYKPWCNGGADAQMSVVSAWMPGVYHLLPVCCVYIENTINFLSSLCLLPYFFFKLLCIIFYSLLHML